jgi:hypothetical protein
MVMRTGVTLALGAIFVAGRGAAEHPRKTSRCSASTSACTPEGDHGDASCLGNANIRLDRALVAT